jgi:hypothetical protein
MQKGSFFGLLGLVLAACSNDDSINVDAAPDQHCIIHIESFSEAFRKNNSKSIINIETLCESTIGD